MATAASATIEPAVLFELITTLKTHVVSQVGFFLDKSTAEFGSDAAQSILDAAALDFPFLIGVSWEAERNHRVARCRKVIHARGEFEKTLSARQREMKIKSFQCKSDGCKRRYASGCLGYCKNCFKFQTDQDDHESKQRSSLPEAGGEDSSVCKADGCHDFHQPNCLGYCNSCFKFYTHQEINIIAWEDSLFKKSMKGGKVCKSGGCNKYRQNRCAGYCIQCFKFKGSRKCKADGCKEPEVCKAYGCSKFREPNYNGYCGQCYTSYYHDFYNQDNGGDTIVTGVESNGSTGENASVLPLAVPGIKESQWSVEDEEDDVDATSQDEREEHQQSQQKDKKHASVELEEETQEDSWAQQTASIDKFVRGRMGYVTAFPASVDTESSALPPIPSATAEGMGHYTTPSPATPAAGRAARATKRSAAAMALEVSTHDRKKPKCSRSLMCEADGCPKLCASHCLGYCVMCFNEHYPEVANERKKLPKTGSTKKQPIFDSGMGLEPKEPMTDGKSIKKRTARLCKTDGCAKHRQYNCEGYCTCCFSKNHPDVANERKKLKRSPGVRKSNNESDSEGSYQPSGESEDGWSTTNAKKKSATLCMSDGCSKFRASKCDGYCMRCFNSHRPQVSNNKEKLSRGRKKASPFRERLIQCHAFLKEHGHLNIPIIQNERQLVLEDEGGLKYWAQKMRMEYRDLINGKYDADLTSIAKKKRWSRGKSKGLIMNRLEMLEEIGFSFEMVAEEEDSGETLKEAVASAGEGSSAVAKKSPGSSRSRVIFDMRAKQCREFKAEKGHINIGGDHPMSSGLYQWAARMRSLYSQRLEQGNKDSSEELSLTTGQKQKLNELESLGFAFDRTFDVNLQNLAAFKAKNGHTKVPSDYAPNKALGHWAENCRRQHNKLGRGESSDYLTLDRLRKLSSVGFTFSTRTKQTELSFDERLEQLKAYREEHGKDPPVSHPELGNWISKQRVYYNHKRDGKGQGIKSLTEEREQKLLDVGFVFRVGPRLDAHALAAQQAGFKKSWDDYLMDFVRWKENHGHPYVPTMCDNEDKKLGRWVAKQRMRYKAFQAGTKIKHGILTAEQALRLANAGFAFDASDIRRTPKDIKDNVAASFADVEAPSNGEEQHVEDGTDRDMEEAGAILPEWDTHGKQQEGTYYEYAQP